MAAGSSSGPDGLLYMAVGDNGSGDNAQDSTVRLGKILRLALTSSGWGPAPGNPYVGGGGGDPYIFALGLRNPFRNAFEGNNLIVADVGEGNVEEVDIIPVTQAGTNFGWPYKEGTRNNRGTVPAGLTLDWTGAAIYPWQRPAAGRINHRRARVSRPDREP